MARVLPLGNLNAALNAPGAAPMFTCRAWVNFNSTNTNKMTIRGSGNVSSVTYNGVGDYTVNFTAAMPDANYAAIVTCNRSYKGRDAITLNVQTDAHTPTSVRIRTIWSAPDPYAGYDITISVAIFR